MTFAYDTRRSTRDLDAVFEPKQTVYAAARRVADNHGLPEDWLNDAVKGFLHGEDPTLYLFWTRQACGWTWPHLDTCWR